MELCYSLILLFVLFHVFFPRLDGPLVPFTAKVFTWRISRLILCDCSGGPPVSLECPGQRQTTGVRQLLSFILCLRLWIEAIYILPVLYEVCNAPLGRKTTTSESHGMVLMLLGCLEKPNKWFLRCSWDA